MRNIAAAALLQVASLRNYVAANHSMETLAFHSISGRDMIRKFGYRECPQK